VSTTLHASCVAIDGRGILLTGASGSGKSDLALRLIDRGAVLVGDDGIVVQARNGRLHARAGPNILAVPATAEAPLALAIALDQAVPRMPDETLPVRVIEGLTLPLLALSAFEPSAPVKVEKALFLYGLSA
jgi:hypothetical protein